jgi:chemotaxis-related protein WspD
MTALEVLPSGDCWNRVGVQGDRSCPELARVVHCHNCEVFAAAGRRFLDAPSPAGYLQEWTRRLAAPVEETLEDPHGVLIFRLGEEWLALPVGVLVEVTTPRPVHRIPHRAGVLAGLVNIRGELHLSAHLDQVLGIARRKEDGDRGGGEKKARERWLVARREAERWVFRVDEVDQVRRFASGALTQPPATVRRAAAHLTRGVFHLEGRTIGLIDDERLFQALRARMR